MMSKKWYLILLTTVCVLALTSITDRPSTAHNDKPTIGWIENVRIYPEGVLLDAKIDTGADHSSLNVSELSEFRRGTKRWVRFALLTTDGIKMYLEKPLVRYAKIKQKENKSQKRPVVQFDLCLGTIYKRAVPVNLSNRHNFKFNMLIGRSFLKNTALVDSSLTNTIEPHCPGK